MLKWTEEIGMYADVSKSDIEYLNYSVDYINEQVGRKFIELKSDPSNENESVDIYEDGLETWSGYTFEETEMYVKGIKKGLQLCGKPSDNK